MKENDFNVKLSGIEELAKNTKIDMSLTEWAAATAIGIGIISMSAVAIQYIRSRERMENKKLDYYYKLNTLNFEMAYI